MPNARQKSAHQDEPATDPVVLVRARADALYRAAIECCRQHDRAAKLHRGLDEPELEHKHVDALCAMSDSSLIEMSEAYEGAAADVHLEGAEEWWHRANGLWHASREYSRHRSDCDDMGKKVSSRHSADQLGSMHMEYELAASALLAMRHAADAYRKTRPDLA
ncbi:MAG: hypothetical protein LH467_03930 [Gemmatimonadaceae bacterium]|nr:hypothetical protein [Gemmatimonadaceae bacterium]